MHIIEDTRQQLDKHNIKHESFEALGVDLIRCKLPFGDYAPVPPVAVDTKKGLEEIAGNICGTYAEHQRVKAEIVHARDAGCKLVFLIENDEGIKCLEDVKRWINPRSVYSTSCVQGPRLAKAMSTMQQRYGCVFLFCDYSETAEVIKSILEGTYEL